jgi:hypothetical protein
VSGVPSGDGVVWYPNGAQYQGQFANGVPNGSGTMIEPKGKSRTGMFVNGQYVKQ